MNIDGIRKTMDNINWVESKIFLLFNSIMDRYIEYLCYNYDVGYESIIPELDTIRLWNGIYVTFGFYFPNGDTSTFSINLDELNDRGIDIFLDKLSKLLTSYYHPYNKRLMIKKHWQDDPNYDIGSIYSRFDMVRLKDYIALITIS